MNFNFCALILVMIFDSYDLVLGESVNKFCSYLTEETLIVILGQAYNPRYMSIQQPGSTGGSETFNKRSTFDLSFYVEDFLEAIEETPAWEINYIATSKAEKHISKDKHVQRQITDRTLLKPRLYKFRPWECSSKITWIDLGTNYFPRYIRSVKCSSDNCWYGHFACKPKSFGVKVLRRKDGTCIKVTNKLVINAQNVNDFAELWIWEEIAVNFCCECVMIY